MRTALAGACVPAHVCVAEAPLGTASVVNLTDNPRVAAAVVAATVTVTAVVPAGPDDLLNVTLANTDAVHAVFDTTLIVYVLPPAGTVSPGAVADSVSVGAGPAT